MRAAELPGEQIIKAQTLGASTWQLVLRVDVAADVAAPGRRLRLTLGSAWLFLIAAEAIASTEVLGYQFFWCAATWPWMSSCRTWRGSLLALPWTLRCVCCAQKAFAWAKAGALR